MNRITVNLPEDTIAGGNTLTAGTYTITDVEPLRASTSSYSGAKTANR